MRLGDLSKSNERDGRLGTPSQGYPELTEIEVALEGGRREGVDVVLLTGLGLGGRASEDDPGSALRIGQGDRDLIEGPGLSDLRLAHLDLEAVVHREIHEIVEVERHGGGGGWLRSCFTVGKSQLKRFLGCDGSGDSKRQRHLGSRSESAGHVVVLAQRGPGQKRRGDRDGKGRTSAAHVRKGEHGLRASRG